MAAKAAAFPMFEGRAEAALSFYVSTLAGGRSIARRRMSLGSLRPFLARLARISGPATSRASAASSHGSAIGLVSPRSSTLQNRHRTDPPCDFLSKT